MSSPSVLHLSVIASLVAAACGGNVVIDGATTSTTSSSSTTSTTGTSSTTGTGGTGGAGLGGSTSGGGGSGGSGLGTLTAIALCDCAIGATASTCSACYAEAAMTLCATQNAACAPGPTMCGDSIACVASCAGDPPCVLDCITAPNVSQDYLTLLSCMCTECGNTCPPAEQCSG